MIDSRIEVQSCTAENCTKPNSVGLHFDTYLLHAAGHTFLHRVDGPAHTVYKSNYEVKDTLWAFYGVSFKSFEEMKRFMRNPVKSMYDYFQLYRTHQWAVSQTELARMLEKRAIAVCLVDEKLGQNILTALQLR